MKQRVIGILAHVDAGKTTLSEAILYRAGSIRRCGRVDHGDTFLDAEELERKRGITIFSKQAVFTWKERTYTLLDTPGHVDFSSETERAIQVMDCAILVISASDGMQGHTKTLWRLLKKFGIPVIIFVNKMDQGFTDRENVFQGIQREVEETCISFLEEEEGKKIEDLFWDEKNLENICMCEEEWMEWFLDGSHDREWFGRAFSKEVMSRKIIPCFFGSALKGEGIEELLYGIDFLFENTEDVQAEDDRNFSARVYKILYDPQGVRMTFLKVVSGELRVKDRLDGEEKVDQIRIYHGNKYQVVECAQEGCLCAVTGLSYTYAGQGFGKIAGVGKEERMPVLMVKVIGSERENPREVLACFRQLEDEDPTLHVRWEESLKEIHIGIMGQMQMEILQEVVRERFGFFVTFGTCEVLYLETIKMPVMGFGHFEPLRHYAEVHVRLEPILEQKVEAVSECHVDELEQHWQNLILTHIQEKEHRGILCGMPLTKVRAVLVSGRSHIKHTEGGDFREATYRAIRQGLEKAENILLEPYYTFEIKLPLELAGRAMADIQKRSGTFQTPITEGEEVVLRGRGPVASFLDYPLEVISYTRGKGSMTWNVDGYDICHNTQEVIEKIGYQKERDLENPSSSVFCSHGKGIVITWDRVEDYLHIEPEKLPEF